MAPMSDYVPVFDIPPLLDELFDLDDLGWVDEENWDSEFEIEVDDEEYYETELDDLDDA